LWRRAQDGDAEAFGDLYERHVRAVQAFCLWRTADTQVAEDVAATTFLEAWRCRARLELLTPTAAAMLLGVATNVMRQQWRTKRRHAAAVERMRHQVRAAHRGHEDDAIARIDAMRRLRDEGSALRGLPRHEREVLALVAWGELSYEETAAALGVPVGTVRSRLSRARARLGDAFPASQPTPTPVHAEASRS